MPNTCSLGGAECQTPNLATQTTKVKHRRDDREAQIRTKARTNPSTHKGRPENIIYFISTGSKTPKS